MDIKESIEFMAKLLQFPELEIVISAETDGINPKANKFKGITFQSYEADSNGNYKPVYSKEAGGIPENKLEAFYSKLYITTERENPNLKLSTFYKLELKYIQGLSASTKEEYFGIIDCITDYLNHRIQTQSIKTYKTFEELYNDAVYYGSIERGVNEIAEANQKNYYYLTFSMWLQENRGWKYADEEHYNTLLTKENWLMYLAYENRNTEKVKADYEAERATWKPPTLKQLVTGNITTEQIKAANESHNTDLLNILSIVSYFEEPICKIQLFKKGNEHCKEQGKQDWEEMDAARKTNHEEVEPYRTHSIIHCDSIHEVDVKELEALFQEKFKQAKENEGFKTEARFSKKELESIKLRFASYRNCLPILEQWFEFLEVKAAQIEVHQQSTQPSELKSSTPLKYNDIFANKDWSKYITALQNTQPPLLNRQGEFIGNAKKHKGVICAWIKSLQYKGVIKQTISRAQLAFVLNREIKNFNLGRDGKTLDNVSTTFDKQFKNQLEALI